MVFKNKNRQFNDDRNKQKHSKYAPYEPNYQRLGIEPMVKDYKKDFISQSNKNRTQTATHPQQPIRQPITNGVREYAWTDGIRDSANENMEKGVDFVDGQDASNPNEEVFHPTHQRVDRSAHYQQQEQEYESDESDFSLNQLADNTYVLMFNDEVVTFGNRSLIEKTIEDILTDTDNQNINIDSFCVIKKLGFSTGIHIDND